MVKFFSLRTAVYFVVDLLISLDQSLHMDEETWFESSSFLQLLQVLTCILFMIVLLGVDFSSLNLSCYNRSLEAFCER